MHLLDGAQHFIKDRSTEPGTLVIMDNKQTTHTYLVSVWFMCKTHHYGTFIIHLVQNIFDKDNSHRAISPNVTYIILFNSPSDISLYNRMYPGDSQILMATYQDAMAMRAHSYMVIDWPMSWEGANTTMPAQGCAAFIRHVGQIHLCRPHGCWLSWSGSWMLCWQDLIQTLGECAINILNCNMVLQPHQKHQLAKQVDILKTLRCRTVIQHSKKVLLIGDGFVGLLADIVALLLIKALPSTMDSMVSLVLGPMQCKRRCYMLPSSFVLHARVCGKIWLSTGMLSTSRNNYCKTSNIRRTLVGDKIVDHSDVVGASSYL